LLLEKKDLPSAGRYVLPGSGWISPSTNAEIVASWTVEEGQAYLAEAGRIHGWWVAYQRGTNNVVMPEEVYNNVVIYSSITGAQLVVTKYDDRYIEEDGYKEIRTSQVGDVCRAFMKTKTEPSGGTRVWLQVVYSYRNIYHAVELWGWQNEVRADFAIDAANQLLGKLKNLPLTDTVEFTP
jgi:hypothetical protein